MIIPYFARSGLNSSLFFGEKAGLGAKDPVGAELEGYGESLEIEFVTTGKSNTFSVALRACLELSHETTILYTLCKILNA